MNGDISLSDGWTTVWTSFSGVMGQGLSTTLTAIGVLLILASFGKWIWQKRSGGGGGNNSGLIVTTIIGAILAGPGIILPAVFKVIDWFIAIVIGLLPQ